MDQKIHYCVHPILGHMNPIYTQRKTYNAGPWRWQHYKSSKRLELFSRRHHIMSQTTWIFTIDFLKIHLNISQLCQGFRGGAVGWGTALQAGRSRVRFPMLSLDFFIDIILPAALLQKWVPGMFPGGKGDRCVGLTTLQSSCAECLEIWEPQPRGTFRGCPGL
jgi:hypothetical protein